MVMLIIGLVCAMLAMMFAALYRAFQHVTAREMKRRARQGDEIAAILYRSVAYGLSAKLLLAGLALISLYGAVVLLDDALGVWLALPVLAVLALAGYIFVESRGGTRKFSVWLAIHASPVIAWVLDKLHPLSSLIERTWRRIVPVHVHSGLYEKSDIVELLDQQKTQVDNRIPEGEIDLVINALSFGDKRVADILVPKRAVKSVSIDDAIGPVLMGELHDSGHSRFPVYEKRKDNIVGILYLHDLLGKKQSGKAADIMRSKRTYVHENFSLYDTLQAFIKTKQHLFIVVNDFEEYVGIITIEDVLEQVIGKSIIDEFDQYDDVRAVATKAANKDHVQHVKQASEAEAISEPTEVVE